MYLPPVAVLLNSPVAVLVSACRAPLYDPTPTILDWSTTDSDVPSTIAFKIRKGCTLINTFHFLFLL